MPTISSRTCRGGESFQRPTFATWRRNLGRSNVVLPATVGKNTTRRLFQPFRNTLDRTAFSLF